MIAIPLRPDMRSAQDFAAMRYRCYMLAPALAMLPLFRTPAAEGHAAQHAARFAAPLETFNVAVAGYDQDKPARGRAARATPKNPRRRTAMST